jgi:hypothetical protein
MEHFESSEDAISASGCGHVFHSACIAQWLDESAQCPQCRSTVDRSHLVRLFLSESCSTPGDDNDSDELRKHLLELAYEQIDDMSKQLAANERQLNVRQVEKLRLERACTAHKSQLERAELKIKHWKLKCERNATLVARRNEQERQERAAIGCHGKARHESK